MYMQVTCNSHGIILSYSEHPISTRSLNSQLEVMAMFGSSDASGLRGSQRSLWYATWQYLLRVPERLRMRCGISLLHKITDDIQQRS